MDGRETMVLRLVTKRRAFGRDLQLDDFAGWRKLVLVRHGETDYDVRRLLPGQLPGVALNERGKAEAQALAEAIRDLPLTSIVASPLQRTLETAAYLNQGRNLLVRFDDDLLDTDYGPYSGQNWEELDAKSRVWRRYTDDPTRAPNGVESFVQVQRRAVRAAERWRRAPNVGEWVALVTHGDLVKLLVAHYLSIPAEGIPLINSDNASLTVLAYQPSPRMRPTLLAYNWTSPASWMPRTTTVEQPTVAVSDQSGG